MDAVKLPAAIAQLPDVKLAPGAIVKVGLLDPGTLKLLQEYNAQQAAKEGPDEGQRGLKRKPDWVQDGVPASVRQALGGKAE